MEGNQSEATPPAGNPPRLLDLVRNAIHRKHYSNRTEEAYIHWIKRFIYFSGKRHPKELGAAGVTAFLNHLLGGGATSLLQPGVRNLEVTICDFKLERQCGPLNTLLRGFSLCAGIV
jgi:hypothetical protein